jgi:hypothetical protein
VPLKHQFEFQPATLLDGTPVDWDLFLLNRLVQSGKLRHTHIVKQIVGAFVTPFFGLPRGWERYNTLYLLADTARNMCPRFYQLLSQNGTIGSRGASNDLPGSGDETSDDDGDDEHRRRRKPGRNRHIFEDPHKVSGVVCAVAMPPLSSVGGNGGLVGCS